MNVAIVAALATAFSPLSNDDLQVLSHCLNTDPLPARFQKFGSCLSEARAVAGSLPKFDAVQVPAVAVAAAPAEQPADPNAGKSAD